MRLLFAPRPTQIIGKTAIRSEDLEAPPPAYYMGRWAASERVTSIFYFFFHPKNGKQNTWKRNEPICGHPPLFALGKHLVVISGKDIQTPFNDNGRQNMMPKPASVTYWIYNAAFNGCEKLFDRLVIQLCQQSSALPE